MTTSDRISTRIRSQRLIGLRLIVAVAAVSSVSVILIAGVDALSMKTGRTMMESRNAASGSTRRNFVGIASAFLATGPFLLDPKPAIASAETDPRERFIVARKDLRDLIENYTDITAKGGGDAVRYRLGTQGVNSKLFGIQKILKTLAADADDIVEYTETMEEFNAYYFQAEGAAYQSMFVEHSSAKGTPESFLKTAKTDIEQMEKYMDQLASQLKL